MTTNPPDETPRVPEDAGRVTPAIGNDRPPTERQRTPNPGSFTRAFLLLSIAVPLLLILLLGPGAHAVVNGDQAGAEAWAGVLDAAARFVGAVADLVRATRGEPQGPAAGA